MTEDKKRRGKQGEPEAAQGRTDASSVEGARVGREGEHGPWLRPPEQQEYPSVLEFLAQRESVSAEDVATGLRMPQEEVVGILWRMESEGDAEDLETQVVDRGPIRTRRFRISDQGRKRLRLTSASESSDSPVVEMETRATPVPEGGLDDVRAPAVVGALDRLAEAVRVARAAAWQEVTGIGEPSLGQLQTWLDIIHDELHLNSETPAHFGSFEANGEFAAKLRLLLQVLGDLKVVDPKSGLPGMLYHRRAGGSPCGQFLFQVRKPSGGFKIGATSASLPRLRLAGPNGL